MRTSYSNDFLSTDDKGLRQAIRANSSLAELSTIISNNSQSLQQLSDSALDYLLQYFDCCSGAMMIYNRQDDTLELTTELGGDTSQPRAANIKPGETLAGNVFAQAETKYLKDVPGDYLRTVRSGTGSLAASHILILPLRFNRTVAGVVELAGFVPFDEEDIAIAERLCEILSATIINFNAGFENSRLLAELKNVQEKTNARVQEQYASMQRLMKEVIEKHEKRERELLEEIEQLKRK